MTLVIINQILCFMCPWRLSYSGRASHDTEGGLEFKGNIVLSPASKEFQIYYVISEVYKNLWELLLSSFWNKEREAKTIH